MTLRDNRRDKAFYDEYFKELEGLIEEDLDPNYQNTQVELSGVPVVKCETISSAAREIFTLVLIGYVRGDSKEALHILYKRFIDVLWESEQCFQSMTRRSPNDINLTDERFALSAIILGSALSFSSDDLEKVAQCIPSGYDQLVDTVMAVYQLNRPISEKLHAPAIYRKLYEVIAAPADQQPKLILKYLNNWEKTLRRDNRWGNHKQPTYKGYWCYEAAALVAVFNIDDSSFLDHEYYPGELMSWRKEG